MTALDIYLLTTLKNIVDVLGLLVCILIVPTILFWYLYCTEKCTYSPSNLKFYLKKARLCTYSFSICLLLAIFLPSPKTILAMYTIPPILESIQTNKELQKLPDNVIKFINQWLEENSKEKEN